MSFHVHVSCCAGVGVARAVFEDIMRCVLCLLFGGWKGRPSSLKTLALSVQLPRPPGGRVYRTRRLPDLIETVGDDALSLAEGTAAGADAAGTALWGLTKEVAAWAADLVLRQALTPVHEYRTSTRRVQAALDEELAALPQASLPPRSSAEKGVPCRMSVA